MWVFKSLTDRDKSDFTKAAYKMPEKKYGLDFVFNRVLLEDILLPFDFDRTKKILTDAFSRKTVEPSEILYLKRKQKNIMKKYKNTFTELYLSNLVHLFADDNARARTRYQEDPLKHPLLFMPDLQQQSVAYQRSDIVELERALSDVTESCILVEARGGIFLQNESLQTLDDLMAKHTNIRLVLRVEPYDAVDSERLLSAMKIIGHDKIVTQFPDFLESKMNEMDGTFITQPIKRDEFSGINKRSSFWISTALSVAVVVWLF